MANPEGSNDKHQWHLEIHLL